MLSDEKAASKKIAAFTDSDARWMVAVRMVSEGVDVPRLAVGVYATTTSTPLFFAQAVGRFVRARGRGETASVFLPSVPNLLGYAAELERQRDHVLGRRIDSEADLMDAEAALLARAEAGEGASDDLLGSFEALGSQARFDQVLFDGATFGHEGEVHVGSEEEMDFLGIPGLLEPDQVRALLHERQRSRRPAAGPEPDDVAEVSTYEQLAVLRRELNGLVAAWHHRTGTAHGITHAELRKVVRGTRRGRRDRRPAPRADRPPARDGGPPLLLAPSGASGTADLRLAHVSTRCRRASGRSRTHATPGGPP